MLTEEHLQFYQANGFVVIRGLFTPEEVADYREYFMAMRASGPLPNDDTSWYLNNGEDDPLKKYPRIIQSHRWDDVSKQWLLDPRLNACLTGLLGREPFAVQTMVYFKPAGARGQALHQDNYYLKARPGTCMAAWMALDPCDEGNGCLRVVPGSHTWDVLCVQKTDTSISFTDIEVPLPPGQTAQSVIMQPGDVLFFNGSIVHGSGPNTSADRFRRSFIGHYIEGDSDHVSKGYHPALRMDGTPLELEASSLVGVTCGVWVEKDGTRAIEQLGVEHHGVTRLE
jgi:phytanoyl-CoA hydroxylase